MIGRVYWLASEPHPRDRAGVGKRRRTHRSFWRVVTRAEPFDTRLGGPARSVLLERVESTTWGLWATPWPPERMIRPFRGLRCV